MRIQGLALVLGAILFFADASYGAWLLWRHSLVTRRVEGAPRGLTPEGNVDKWELLNAVELRKECIAALKAEHKKSYDSLQAAYPSEPVSQSIVADGISGSVSTGAEKGGAAAKTTQLYYEYTFWCLPAGVDPKTIRPGIEKEKK
jgi:hypothetical protein